MNKELYVKSIDEIRVDVTLNDGSNALLSFSNIKEPIIDIVNNTKSKEIMNGLIVGQELKECYQNIVIGNSDLQIDIFDKV